MLLLCYCIVLLVRTRVSTGTAADIPGDFNVSASNVTFSASAINLENPILADVVFNDAVCMCDISLPYTVHAHTHTRAYTHTHTHTHTCTLIQAGIKCTMYIIIIA